MHAHRFFCPVPYIDNLVLDPDLAFALKVALRHAASKAVPSPELPVYFLQALQEKLTDDSHFIVVCYITETSTGKLYFQYAAPICKTSSGLICDPYVMKTGKILQSAPS